MHVTTITLSFLGYFQDSHLREMCANSIHQIVSLVYDLLLSACLIQRKTSKTTFNNDQPRSGKEKDLWLETIHET